MNFKSNIIRICACIVVATSFNTNAAIITHGNLTTDDTTNFITDTVSGRQYMRFDTFNLSVADTVLATNAGGIYEEWAIATSTIADDFYESALGAASTSCTGAVTFGTMCGITSNWSDGDFGDSYDESFDYFWFFSTYDTPLTSQQDIGLGVVAYTGNIYDFDDWKPSSYADKFGIRVSTQPINALLYREVSTVPVPAAVWLFSAGFIGLIGIARRKNND